MNTCKIILDFGNTMVKLAELDAKDEVISVQKIVHNDLEELLSSYKKKTVVFISNVTNYDIKKLDLYKNLVISSFSNSTKLPISLSYKTPITLGQDRLANAVALKRLYPNQDSLSVDVGTCVKFDLVTSNSEYIGGSISPGLEMRFRALNHFTAKLPYIDWKKVNFNKNNFIGNSSEESIISGCFFGMIGEIKQTIMLYKEQYPNINVVLTGGDSQYLSSYLKKCNIFVNENLTLKGLNEIYKFNNH